MLGKPGVRLSSESVTTIEFGVMTLALLYSSLLTVPSAKKKVLCLDFIHFGLVSQAILLDIARQSGSESTSLLLFK